MPVRMLSLHRGHELAGAAVELDAARRLDLVAVLQLTQRVDGRLDEILGAGRAVGLGEDVGDADELEARADALAGGDAGARAGGSQDDRAGAAAALDGVRDGGALQVHLEHLLAGVLGPLLDRVRDLVGLAVADADVALAVADDDQRAERERAAALDDLRAAVDADDGRLDARLVGAAVAVAARAAPATAT